MRDEVVNVSDTANDFNPYDTTWYNVFFSVLVSFWPLSLLEIDF